MNKNSRKRMDNQKKQYQIKLFEHFIITCIYFYFFKKGVKKHWTIELKEISKVNGGDCRGNMLDD